MAHSYDRRADITSPVSVRDMAPLLQKMVELLEWHAKHGAMDDIVKEVIRFQQQLGSKGLRLRDPKAVAEDLLYKATDVTASIDVGKAKAVLKSYL